MIRELALPRELDASTAGRRAGAAAWDELRFRAFYETTAARLRGYLRRACGSAQLAEDLAQESYLRFLRSRAAESDEIEPVRFLFKIATNLLHDHWRRARRERSLLGWLRPEPQPRDAALARDVGRVLDLLKPRDRALVWLAYVEGFSHDEIASIVGLRPLSVRVMLFRARARLAGALAKAGIGVEVLR
jgi:RNA polymerase sigma-70 factor (ECF subfamily)